MLDQMEERYVRRVKGRGGCGRLITCRRVFGPFSRPTAPIQVVLRSSKCPGYSYSAGIETGR